MKKKYFDLSLSIRFPASNNKYCPTGGWLKDRIQAAENYQILWTRSFTLFLRTPSERSQRSLFPILLCYVMWNLFTVGSSQFCNDNTITSLKMIILICVHTKASKLHKPSVGRGLKIYFYLKHRISQKHLQRRI